MTRRLIVMFGVLTAAILPVLPGPAEPGGGIQRAPALTPQGKSTLVAAQKELQQAVVLMGKTRTEMTASLKKAQTHGAAGKAQLATALKLAQEPGAKNADQVAAIRKALESAMKELEAQDRMGNFEIQRLMSAYNQAETLSSNVQKKLDDTISGQQQKIGGLPNDTACCS